MMFRVRCMSCGDVSSREDMQMKLANLNPASADLAYRLSSHDSQGKDLKGVCASQSMCMENNIIFCLLPSFLSR